MSSLRDLFNIQLLKGKELRKNKKKNNNINIWLDCGARGRGLRLEGSQSGLSMSSHSTFLYIFIQVHVRTDEHLFGFCSVVVPQCWNGWILICMFHQLALDLKIPPSHLTGCDQREAPRQPAWFNATSAVCVKPTQSTREGWEGRSSSAASRISP